MSTSTWCSHDFPEVGGFFHWIITFYRLLICTPKVFHSSSSYVTHIISTSLSSIGTKMGWMTCASACLNSLLMEHLMNCAPMINLFLQCLKSLLVEILIQWKCSFNSFLVEVVFPWGSCVIFQKSIHLMRSPFFHWMKHCPNILITNFSSSSSNLSRKNSPKNVSSH